MGKEIVQVEQHYLAGAAPIKKYDLCRLYAKDTYLVIDQLAGVLFKKNQIVQTFQIPFDRIQSVEVEAQTIYTEKSKSTIARSVTGAAIAGPTGALVGAASATGKKRDSHVEYFMWIHFKDANGVASKLKFRACATVSKSRKFAKYITETYLIPLRPPKDSGPHIL